MVSRYFAYGSNMNPDRVRQRGIAFSSACGARLSGYELVFDKTSAQHEGLGHANLAFAPGRWVEGVLYLLDSADEIFKMDRFEKTPVNYSREVVQVLATGSADAASEPAVSAGFSCWTYFANPAVRQPGLKPPRSYMQHLLAGQPYLSSQYFQKLSEWPCEESR